MASRDAELNSKNSEIVGVKAENENLNELLKTAAQDLKNFKQFNEEQSRHWSQQINKYKHSNEDLKQ